MNLLLVLVLSSALAQPVCDKRFFQDVQELSARQVATKLDNSRAWASPAAFAAAVELIKGAAHSLSEYEKMLLAQTAAFGEALRSGEYFSDKLHGRDIYRRVPPRLPKPPLGGKALFKAMALQAMIFFEVYFYMDPSPKRCNATVEGLLKTQVISGGQCVDKIAFSENTFDFLNRPLEEQVKLAAEFPSVCTFYQKLLASASPSPQPARPTTIGATGSTFR